ncbi:MAG: hypothetical protein LBT14_08200 [Treponema sp.]|jgi:hypothetical protein|nr:hypothetical protein [Treponema sp.]
MHEEALYLHEHTHPHEHPHTHEHTHPHEHAPEDNLAQLKTLLAYMLDHNREHTGELGDMAKKLHQVGLCEAADLIDTGVKDFEKGNEKLAKALALINGGPLL